jgi:hypothetical protein
MRILAVVFALLLTAPASAAFYWAVLEQPTEESEALLLAADIDVLGGTTTVTLGDVLTQADIDEMRASGGRMFTAIRADIEAERTSGTDPFEKRNRHYAAMIVGRDMDAFQAALTVWVGQFDPTAADWYRIIVIDTNLTGANLAALGDAITRYSEVNHVRPAP